MSLNLPSVYATLAAGMLLVAAFFVHEAVTAEDPNDRLRAAGFEVRTFPGSELCINGSGGPTCLTRPMLRG